VTAQGLGVMSAGGPSLSLLAAASGGSLGVPLSLQLAE
jgi:hypothetical protein